MYTLGIETTCDETAASIVKDGVDVLSNIIFSQEDIHKKYGGVFPELASRSHLENIIYVIDKALTQANITKEEIDLIAVANGPGLLGSILIGLNVAKTLAYSLNKPLIGVNHIEAHLYASMMNDLEKVQFPSLGVVLSGGHTELVEILDIGKYVSIGKTIDDAIGEAFDKVAVMLNLPYPGGPEIEKLAKDGDENRYQFSPGRVKNSPFDFSFSGLKTKVLYTIKGQQGKKHDKSILKDIEKKHVAASFQKASFNDVIEKILLAINKKDYRAIYLGGGVTKSKKLKEMLHNRISNIPIYWPEPGFSLDNGAMIAGLGYQKFIKTKTQDSLDLCAKTRIPLV